MTVRARDVARVQGSVLHLRAVACSAGGEVRRLQTEMMRLVAPRTGDAAVPAVLGKQAEMTRRAGARGHIGERHVQARSIRMRIMARDAAALTLGMVRVDTLVTVRAGVRRRSFHGVW